MIGTDRHTRTLNTYLAHYPERKIYRHFFSKKKNVKNLFVPPPPPVSFPFLPPEHIVSHCRRKNEKKKDSKRYGFLTIDHNEQNVAKKEPVFCRGSLRTRMKNDCKISNCNILILICRCA